MAALKNSRDTSREHFGAAVAAAEASEVVLLFLGEEQILSGEAHSRAFLNLPGAQESLFQEIVKTGKPVIAIILAGRPLTFHDVAAMSASVLYAWHPGTMGGPALVDVLSGDRSPSGRLAITFPRTVGQIPIYYAHLNTGRPAAPGELGIPMGNPVNPQGYHFEVSGRRFHSSVPLRLRPVLHQFEYSGIRVSSFLQPQRQRRQLSVSADITNKGNRRGRRGRPSSTSAI